MSDSSDVDPQFEDSREEDLNQTEKESDQAEEGQLPINQEERLDHTPYKNGQILKFVRVRFPGNARSFPFLLGRRKFSYGQKVVAMSDRGMAVGYINSFPYDAPFQEEMMPIRSISKVATNEDIQKQLGHFRKEKEAEQICLKFVDKHRLDMNITHVEFTQFGKKAVFYFVAPQRVDFRNLVKDLVTELKMRIELRQISVRDRAAAVGGIGPCGLQLCCSSFLSKFGNVNIKMAKNQNLTLIPSKLNGVCGQLKCCVKYEDEVYADKRYYLPKEGEIIRVRSGEIGKVTSILVLEEQFQMLTDKGIFKKYSISQYDPDRHLPENYRFPENFDHISYENQTVHGQAEYEQQKLKSFRENISFNFPKDRTLAFQYFNFLNPEEVTSELEKNSPFYLKKDFVFPNAKILYDSESGTHKLDFHEYDSRQLSKEEIAEMNREEGFDNTADFVKNNLTRSIEEEEDELESDTDLLDEEEEMLAETDGLIKDTQKLLKDNVQLKSWTYQEERDLGDNSGDFQSSAGKKDQKNRRPFQKKNRNPPPSRRSGGNNGGPQGHR